MTHTLSVSRPYLAHALPRGDVQMCIKVYRTTSWYIIIYIQYMLYFVHTLFSIYLSELHHHQILSAHFRHCLLNLVRRTLKSGFYLSSISITGLGDWWPLRQGMLSFLISELSIFLRVWWHTDPFLWKRRAHGLSLNAIVGDWLNPKYESRKWMGSKIKY